MGKWGRSGKETFKQCILIYIIFDPCDYTTYLKKTHISVIKKKAM